MSAPSLESVCLELQRRMSAHHSRTETYDKCITYGIAVPRLLMQFFGN